MARASKLLLAVRRELAAVGNAERRAGAQAYMKTTDAFHGVAAADMRRVAKRLFAEVELADAATWRGHVLELWRGARFREERYCAIELAADRRAKTFHDLDALAMFEEMVVSGAWWDTVDPIATHRVGLVLAREPKPVRKAMLAWSRCDDMWKRRTAILCQARRGRSVDLELLFACIEPSLASKEFFLRKAIGWALREVTRHDPEPIERYVRANKSRLSTLSKREALKRLLASGAVERVP